MVCTGQIFEWLKIHWVPRKASLNLALFYTVLALYLSTITTGSMEIYNRKLSSNQKVIIYEMLSNFETTLIWDN